MTDAAPWTLLDSRHLLRDRWLSVRVDRVRTPTGAELAPWYVLEYPDWVAAVVLTEDDRLVMVRTWRHAVQAWTLEIPAGVMDPEDSDPIAAARRETLEETGYMAAEWRYLFAGYANPATHTNRLHLVLGTGATRAAAPAHEPGETIEVACLPVTEVLAGIGESRLGQTMHVGGVLYGLAVAGRIRW